MLILLHANKPVSTATTTALALKANLASPTFTGASTLTCTAKITSNMYTDGYIVVGNVAGNSLLVTESALQVCAYRVGTPTQFGVHSGTDYGTWDCGMSFALNMVVVKPMLISPM